MEIKLRLRDMLSANMAFAQCDGVKDMKTRWNIVKNKRLLQAQFDDYEELRVQLVMSLSPQNKDISKEPVAVQEEFRLKTKQLLDSECSTTGLLTLNKKFLLEGNVPLPVLDAIFPFIQDDDLPETPAT